MNLFARGKNRKKFFFRGKAEADKHSEPAVEDLSSLRRQYVHFCESPVVRPEASAADFLELCAHECVDKVAITSKDDGVCLLLGLKSVILRNQTTNRLHEIGRMLIVMRRKPEVQVSFFNLDRVIKCADNSYSPSFHHPHVSDEGYICSNYRGPLMQDLAAGHTWSAVSLAIEALHAYGPGIPMCPIEKWPWAQKRKETRNA